MAQITITPTRTKAATTITLTEDIIFADTTGAEISNLEAVGANEAAFPLVIESLPSDVYPTTAGAYTVDSPGGTGSSITLTNVSAGVFTYAKLGDLVFAVNDTTTVWNAADDPTTDTAGDEDFTAGQGNGFAVGAYISALDSGASTMTIAVSAGDVLVDQTARSAGEIAFRRNGIKVTIAHIGIGVNVTGNNITLSPCIYTHDGTKAFDGIDQDGYDDLTTADGTCTALTGVSINYDTFLTNARVARSNA